MLIYQTDDMNQFSDSWGHQSFFPKQWYTTLTMEQTNSSMWENQAFVNDFPAKPWVFYTMLAYPR